MKPLNKSDEEFLKNICESMDPNLSIEEKQDYLKNLPNGTKKRIAKILFTHANIIRDMYYSAKCDLIYKESKDCDKV